MPAEPHDELARKRREKHAPGIPSCIETVWSHLNETISWAEGAEDALETGDYTCLVCGKNVGLGEHEPTCIGANVREARRAAERAKNELERKYAELFE